MLLFASRAPASKSPLKPLTVDATGRPKARLSTPRMKFLRFFLLSMIDVLCVSYILFQDVEGNIMTSNATNSSIKDEQAIRALLQMLTNPYTPTKVLSSRFHWVRPNHFHFDPEKKLLRNLDTGKAVDLGNATAIGKKHQFVWYNKEHRRTVMELTDKFESAKNPWEIFSITQALRDSINTRVFVTALLYLLESREDFQHVKIPSIAQVLPDLFFPEVALNSKQEDNNIQWKEGLLERTRRQVFPQVPNFSPQFFPGAFPQPFFRAGVTPNSEQQRPPLFVEWHLGQRRTDIAAEEELAYWREDFLLNGHHWHWHLVHQLGRPSVRRHRKGEQFYYMHRNMVVRYNWERLSLGMDLVEAYEDLKTPIREGYSPRFNGGTGERWGAREPNTQPQDVNRELNITLNQMEVWRTRLQRAIRTRTIMRRDGIEIAMRDVDIPMGGRLGIDILGDATESDWFTSDNYQFYGDYHNFGHYIISATHDPKGLLNEPLGIMSEPVTAVRDPIFFRWHKHIDDLFEMYKISQRPYSRFELSLPGVELVNAGLMDSSSEPNVLHTFFRTSVYNARFGIDFMKEESDTDYRPVVVRTRHLDHRPFSYLLQINNHLPTRKKVVVRIFMAPKEDSWGQPMTFSQQRRQWGEMDVFDVDLVPGLNSVTRLSRQSSILGRERFARRGQPGSDFFDYFGCGWPPHLLLPRGTTSGMKFQVFIMLTDADRDLISTSRVPRNSFCVPPQENFQDRRPMGFPLDRRMRMGSTLTIAELFEVYPNALVVDVDVMHVE
ncbi:phenoloxidase 2-like isoform X2 [Penaeus monodon]|uniref:phenoloxidase 2-like isoform X2 n=1 Tax=Penaeus monodon TaxID=6687 RepID=UPI0018A704E9|nr:phenoloxidase 2-like isoform X2 [Penaeus monodon]